MVLMGGDFQYTDANRWYTNLDKLIQLVRGNKALISEIYPNKPLYDNCIHFTDNPIKSAFGFIQQFPLLA